jgi:outer membrane biosynthesis protein TonB
MIIGGAVATFVAAGAVVFFTLGPGKTWLGGEAPAPPPAAVQAPEPEPAPVPTPTPAPAQIAITFVSNPDGALVKEGDTILGPTPYLLTTTASDTPREFSISFTGYETQTLSQPLTKTEVIKTTLEKIITASAEPEPPKEIKGKPPKESKPPKGQTPKESKPPSEPGDKIDSTTTLVPSFGKKE